MNSETKQCQNCKQNFTILSEDFDFYERIQVPPPTFCPDCRLQRRFTYRNERMLYRRICGICGKHILSNFSESNSPTVHCQECWWSDKWDASQYGRDYDFSKPFFKQYQEFVKQLPNLNLWAFSNEQSEYTNYTAYGKNIYLAYSVVYAENIFYSSIVDRSRDCIDCYKVRDSELCYGSIDVNKIHNSCFLINSRECINSWFLFDCVNCQNCFMCSNLRNKQFYFRNQSLSKNDYFKTLEKIRLGSYETTRILEEEFKNLVKNSLHKFANIIKVVNSSGDNLMNTKNTLLTFDSWNTENVKYCWRVFNYKDSYDVSGSLDSELCYEASVGGDHHYGSKFYTHSNSTSHLQYSHFCPLSSYLFGCYGLRSKQYCILNKQYSKESFDKLRTRIIQHMNEMPYVDKKGRIYKYGEFFPAEISPFAYNETMAQDYFPLTKEQAIKQGFRWKEPEERNYQITLKSGQLPDHIQDVPDSITNEVIQCAHVNILTSDVNKLEIKCNEQCTTAFKIIPAELQFYRKMNLPLPRLCPNCRHYQRLKQRNPLKLWHRQCMCDYRVYQNIAKHPHHPEGQCPNEFETSYSPERKEIVYCEQCYNAEVV